MDRTILTALTQTLAVTLLTAFTLRVLLATLLCAGQCAYASPELSLVRAGVIAGLLGVTLLIWPWLPRVSLRQLDAGARADDRLGTVILALGLVTAAALGLSAVQLFGYMTGFTPLVSPGAPEDTTSALLTQVFTQYGTLLVLGFLIRVRGDACTGISTRP